MAFLCSSRHFGLKRSVWQFGNIHLSNFGAGLSEEHFPFTERLRTELLRAAHHRRAHRQRRARRVLFAGPVALIAVFVIAVAISTTSFNQGKSDAGVLSVTQVGDTVTVTLLAPTND